MITKQKIIFKDGLQIGVEEYQISDADYISECVAAVQQHLDSTAKAYPYRYDDIKSAVDYVGDKNPKFAAEGQAFKDWRSDCWTMCYQILDDVQNNLRPAPTIAELLAELPAFSIE